MKFFRTTSLCALASVSVLAAPQDARTCANGLKADEMGMIQETADMQANLKRQGSFLTLHDGLAEEGALATERQMQSEDMQLGSAVMRVKLQRGHLKLQERLQKKATRGPYLGHGRYAPPPRRQLEALQVRQRSLAQMQAQHKTSYYGPVTVGRHTLVVVFDTGSGNLIIPSTDCRDKACMQHQRFDPNTGNTRRVACDGSGQEKEDRIRIGFGTGQIEGQCFNDEICVGGICSRGDFIGANHESWEPFGEFQFDGVLGMGTLSLAQGSSFSLMSHMGPHLKRQVFSFYLSDLDSEPSEVIFGEAPEDLMAGPITWAGVQGNSGYWSVKIGGIALDNRIFPSWRPDETDVFYAAVDTGTSMLAGPTTVLDKMRAKIPVDCDTYRNLPPLGFQIGDDNNNKVILNLDPEDYVDEVEDYGRKSCELSFMNLDVPPPQGPLFVLGVPFLRKYLTVYDSSAKKVGFALAKHQSYERPKFGANRQPDAYAAYGAGGQQAPAEFADLPPRPKHGW